MCVPNLEGGVHAVGRYHAPRGWSLRRGAAKDDKKKKERYDLVMEAVGRIPNTKNLNLKSTNVKINNNGAIIVDKYFKTSVKNIFAKNFFRINIFSQGFNFFLLFY